MIPLALLASPLARKVMFYGLITVAVLVAFWAYRRSLINQGIQVGISRGAEAERKAREAEWKVREEQLAAQAQALTEREEAVDRQVEANQLDRVEIEKERAAVTAAMKNIYVESKRALEAELAAIRAVSDADLDDALRSLSARIATWQAAHSPGAPPNR